MTPSNGNPKSIKLHPDALFGWLDEETLNQPEKTKKATEQCDEDE